jgi:hypothetical protein
MDVKYSRYNYLLIDGAVEVTVRQWELIKALARHIAESEHGATRFFYHFGGSDINAFGHAEKEDVLEAFLKRHESAVCPSEPIWTFYEADDPARPDTALVFEDFLAEKALA